MAHITLDTALNLVWVAIGLFALVVLAGLEIGRFQHSGVRARVGRLCAMGLVMVALFPCVSFSDDLFLFSFLLNHAGKQGAGAIPPDDPQEKPSTHLFRLLQTLDHYQVTAASAVAVTLWFFFYVVLERREFSHCVVLHTPGRAPPLL